MMNQWQKNKAFTLIEMLVVLAMMATLLSLVAPKYFDSISRSKESALKYNLTVMRDAIDKYYSDQNGYPPSLQALVNGKYLRDIPVDPMTDSAYTWTISPPPDVNVQGDIYDIHSGSPLIAKNGTPYASW